MTSANLRRLNYCAFGFLVRIALVWISLACMASTGCRPATSNTGRVLRLVTTTSTRDSGLLDQLLPEFERQQDCTVRVIAVGTGAALKLGQRGDADVLIVHAREAELAFMNDGHGVRHEEFMENHFVIVGPAGDPVRAGDADSPTSALKRVAKEKTVFVSRGDDSGTHKREQQLWELAGGLKRWPNYLSVGQGMGDTLRIADEKRGYTLSDTGTYRNLGEELQLEIVVAGGTGLRNPYAAIVVNPSKSTLIDSNLANQFVDFLIADATQRRIADYTANGEPFFTPTRLLK